MWDWHGREAVNVDELIKLEVVGKEDRSELVRAGTMPMS